MNKIFKTPNIIYPHVFFLLSIYDHNIMLNHGCYALHKIRTDINHPGLSEIDAPIGSQEVVGHKFNSQPTLVSKSQIVSSRTIVSYLIFVGALVFEFVAPPPSIKF